jgi:predicted metal-dependent phosphoesterase TrpH
MAEALALLDYVETKTDLDVIAITDHDDIRGAWAAREIWARGRYRFDFVAGIEVTTIEGHLLALYLEEPVPSLRPVEEVLAAVHRQGGICVIPHPMSPLTRSLDRKTIARIAASKSEGIYFDGIEAVHRSPFLGAWRRTGTSLNRALDLNLAELASSDSHFLTTIGSARTEFPGRTGEDLKTAIVQRTTRAITGHCPTLLDIGLGQVLSQTVRGLTATPRVMGWGPTAFSFVRRILHRG